LSEVHVHTDSVIQIN